MLQQLTCPGTTFCIAQTSKLAVLVRKKPLKLASNWWLLTLKMVISVVNPYDQVFDLAVGAGEGRGGNCFTLFGGDILILCIFCLGGSIY